jgi:hypothetical protein
MAAIPLLRTRVTGTGIRLELGEWSYGNGRTLDEASADLVERLMALAAALRQSGLRIHSEAPRSDPAYFDFLWELGGLAGGSDAIRELVFGGPRPEA